MLAVYARRCAHHRLNCEPGSPACIVARMCLRRGPSSPAQPSFRRGPRPLSGCSTSRTTWITVDTVVTASPRWDAETTCSNVARCWPQRCAHRMQQHAAAQTADWKPAYRAALYYTGFFGLPWLWLVNIWLFWPAVRAGSDPEIMRRAPLSILSPPWYMCWARLHSRLFRKLRPDSDGNSLCVPWTAPWTCDAVTRRSGIGAAVVAAVLLPWTFTFMIGASHLRSWSARPHTRHGPAVRILKVLTGRLSCRGCEMIALVHGCRTRSGCGNSLVWCPGRWQAGPCVLGTRVLRGVRQHQMTRTCLTMLFNGVNVPSGQVRVLICSSPSSGLTGFCRERMLGAASCNPRDERRWDGVHGR